MFKKILIANRGEIARRIIKTCKRLGIQTVAIYSEADNNALHVREADESYEVGKPRVNESYLQMDKIIEVAKAANVDAIHPGYGLLSENAEFARKCGKANIVFIGPKATTIEAMGDKINARLTMSEADVPIVPGKTTPLSDVEEAVKLAEEIGYPVMLKASAGGGGIGMQLATDEENLRKIYDGTKTRAENFFGNGAMYIEKYIDSPHHIEVQLLADSFGNVVYLWERECSIQRRNQKVVEEAPSPFVDEELRKKLGEVATKAAKHIGYVSAGTIEFLMDAQKNFYFLEMNTRLQVEHPVTEWITGLDLVEQQLLIASGEKLSFTQQEVQLTGHAIEARIYAEDPKTFYPSPGTIQTVSFPEGENVRNDTAIENGIAVTPFYDPMIAKLITYGETRELAIKQMSEALATYKIEGIKTNIPVLQEIVAHPMYESGNYTTKFIEIMRKKGE